MQSMLDLIKGFSPEGLECYQVGEPDKETLLFDVCFTFQGLEHYDKAYKTIENTLGIKLCNNVDRINAQRCVCDAMVYFAQQLNDRDMEYYWSRIKW